MRVVYLERASRRTNKLPAGDDDVIELLSNNWNDHGFETTFPTVCRINGQEVELGMVRLLIEGVDNTRLLLNRLLHEGWDGEFPIPETNYLSVPAEITFYEQLHAVLGSPKAVRIAEVLRDASYLVRAVEDRHAQSLVESEGFQRSLQRERGSIKSYLDGWKIFAREDIAVLDLGFRFKDVYNDTSTLNLRFQPRNPLPHDINVLIGPNGSGKSQLLHQIVSDWIDESEDETLGFVSKPNLSQIVVVSYSPFEQFPVDLKRRNLSDSDAYRYFGFRGRTDSQDPKKLGRVRLSHEFPKRNAAQSLLACLSHDKRYQTVPDLAQKIITVERVLRTAFEFDYAAVRVDGRPLKRFYSSELLAGPLSLEVKKISGPQQYIPIASDRIDELNERELSKNILAEDGVTFFLDGEIVALSSGQRLFAYVVINILGAIRSNSLILVDEPELFLHPTLEIQFVDMLKKILTQFNSKALLATHSVVTVREIPRDCVHVLERTDEGLVIKQPPFQTFGGDNQRISSYVFGDQAISKPFERWVTEQIDEFGSGAALIEALGHELNEELIVQIKAMERGQW